MVPCVAAASAGTSPAPVGAVCTLPCSYSTSLPTASLFFYTVASFKSVVTMLLQVQLLLLSLLLRLKQKNLRSRQEHLQHRLHPHPQPASVTFQDQPPFRKAHDLAPLCKVGARCREGKCKALQLCKPCGDTATNVWPLAARPQTQAQYRPFHTHFAPILASKGPKTAQRGPFPFRPHSWTPPHGSAI